LGYLYALKPRAQPVNRHYISAVATFVVFGFISLPIRALHGYDSGQLLYYRVAFALLCLVGIIAGFRRDSLRSTLGQYRAADPPEKRKFVRNLLVGSAFLTINWLAFIYVLNHISVQTGSFSYLLCPIVTTLLGSLLLKEKLHPTQWIALGISATACALIGVDSLYNLSFSLFIATSYALYLITQRILRDYDRIVLLAVQVLLALAFLTALGPSFRGVVPAEGFFYANIFVLSSLFTVFPLFLNAYALKGLPASTLGALMYINPIINFALAFFYYGERASSAQWAAYALIAVSVVVANARNWGVGVREFGRVGVKS
jgi:chloramphenicol-sensitive protein RarD